MKKEEIYNKYNGKCAYCGTDITLKEMQIDHIIPRIFFETSIQNKHNIPQFLSHLKENDVNHIANLNPSCKYCNNYKSNFNLEEFRFYLKLMINEKLEYLFKSKTKMQVAINMRCLKLEKWDGIFYFEKLQEHKIKIAPQQ